MIQVQKFLYSMPVLAFRLFSFRKSHMRPSYTNILSQCLGLCSSLHTVGHQEQWSIFYKGHQMCHSEIQFSVTCFLYIFLILSAFHLRHCYCDYLCQCFGCQQYCSISIHNPFANIIVLVPYAISPIMADIVTTLTIFSQALLCLSSNNIILTPLKPCTEIRTRIDSKIKT